MASRRSLHQTLASAPYIQSSAFGSSFSAGWHSVLVSFSYTSAMTVIVDGIPWMPVRVGNLDVCPIQTSTWAQGTVGARLMAVGDGGPPSMPPGLATPGNPPSYALGDVQIYSASIPTLWSTGITAAGGNATGASPPPPYMRLGSAPKVSACVTNAPFSRYGGPVAYPVIGDIAIDYGTPGGNPAEVIVSARNAPFLSSLNFSVARALDLGPIDMSNAGTFPTLTVAMMSDSVMCSNAPLFDVSGYTVSIVNPSSSCASLGPTSGIVVQSSTGTSVTLTGNNATITGGFLPTARPNTYVAVSLTATGVSVFVNGRIWASSSTVTWAGISTERNAIFGYGNVLDVQLYRMPAVNVNQAMRQIALGSGNNC